LPLSIWDDQSFRSLTRDAQWLYFLLLSQPQLNQAGMIPTLPQRWTRFTTGVTAEENEKALAELESAGWTCTDWGDWDTFVSGYFEAEQIARQPRRLIGATTAINEAHSPRLRAIASAELSALIAVAPEPQPPRGMRAAVLERDDYQCRTCGWKPGDPVPIKKKTDRPVYRGLEIDHIYPKSLGGLDEESNFQVLCTTCNCRKGARILCPCPGFASTQRSR
jgi:hypothetical protein